MHKKKKERKKERKKEKKQRDTGLLWFAIQKEGS